MQKKCTKVKEEGEKGWWQIRGRQIRKAVKEEGNEEEFNDF